MRPSRTTCRWTWLFGGHVHDDIALHRRLAAKAPPFFQAADAVIARFDLRSTRTRRPRARSRRAWGNRHMTGRPGISSRCRARRKTLSRIDAQLARGGQDRRADGGSVPRLPEGVKMTRGLSLMRRYLVLLRQTARCRPSGRHPLVFQVAHPARRRRPPARPPRSAASGSWLNLIQAAPPSSWFSRKLAARIASISLPGRGLVEPMPKSLTKVSSSMSGGRDDARGLDRGLLLGDGLGADRQRHGVHDRAGHARAEGHGLGKALLIPCRLGSPEGRCSRPRRSCSRPPPLAQPGARRGEDLVPPAVAMAPNGHDEAGRPTIVMGRDTEIRAARSTIFLATAKRTSGSSRNAGVVVGDRHNPRHVCISLTKAAGTTASEAALTSPVIPSSATGGHWRPSEAPGLKRPPGTSERVDAERAVGVTACTTRIKFRTSASARKRNCCRRSGILAHFFVWKRPRRFTSSTVAPSRGDLRDGRRPPRERYRRARAPRPETLAPVGLTPLADHAKRLVEPDHGGSGRDSITDAGHVCLCSSHEWEAGAPAAPPFSMAQVALVFDAAQREEMDALDIPGRGPLPLAFAPACGEDLGPAQMAGRSWRPSFCRFCRTESEGPTPQAMANLIQRLKLGGARDAPRWTGMVKPLPLSRSVPVKHSPGLAGEFAWRLRPPASDRSANACFRQRAARHSPRSLRPLGSMSRFPFGWPATLQPLEPSNRSLRAANGRVKSPRGSLDCHRGEDQALRRGRPPRRGSVLDPNPWQRRAGLGDRAGGEMRHGLNPSARRRRAVASNSRRRGCRRYWGDC